MEAIEEIVEAPDTGSPGEPGEQPGAGEAAGADGAQPGSEAGDGQATAAADTDPYSTRFSREMRAALRQWEQANPEAAKFARQARDNHARLFALTQLEPKGIEGVREKYALLDSMTVGEMKGPEAVAAMREQLGEIEQLDEMIASGDARSLEAFGEDFNEGLARLAPALLERVERTNPEEFQAAVLPYVVRQLTAAGFFAEYNALVDVLNAQNDPRFDDATKFRFTFQQIEKMTALLNGLGEKAAAGLNGKHGGAGANGMAGNGGGIADERSELERQRQDFHWETKIAPQASQHENKTFETMFEPYQKRLRLDAAGKAALLEDFKAGMNRAGAADVDYMRQMKLWRGQRNPDPAAVGNFVKAAISRHARPVMDALIKARYGSILAANKPRTAASTNGSGAKAAARGPEAPNVEMRTVKPPMNEIDHRRTPLSWLAMKQYRLTNGKVVRVVQQ